VEYEGVARRQFAGVGNNLIGVINRWIERDTPGFVPDQPSTVLASRIGRIAIAVRGNR